MDSVIKRQRIASLIFKERLIGLEQREQEELEHWRRTDSRNEAVYIRLRKQVFNSDSSVYQQINIDRALERYRKRFLQKKKTYFIRWRQIAAVVGVLIGVAWVIFYCGNRNESLSGWTVSSQGAVVLVLDDGQKMELSKVNDTVIIASEGVYVQNDGVELRYPDTKRLENQQTARFNELIVPKGAEYAIVLSDGTKVWLNSQTRLKYPVTFEQVEREVYLEGEAYFEVAKDEMHPFRVRAKNGVAVEVLGTSFNVKSYADEEVVETVLEEGRVRMMKGADSVVLYPGYKAVYRPGYAMLAMEVDTELYTTWRFGQYIFKNEKVENILKQLVRWYDFEVFYSNKAAKEVIFSGDVTKYETIDVFLKAMEMTSALRFTRNGKTLVVSLEK